MLNYGYTSIRTTVTGIAGTDAKGNRHLFGKSDVIINRVNGAERSVTVLDRPNGKAVARLVSARY